MRYELDHRTWEWLKAVLFSLLFLAISLAALALAISERDIFFIVLASFLTVLFALIAYLFLSPRMQACMTVVGGEMGYRELQAAIAREFFSSPIRFLGEKGRTELFLLSDKWLLIGDEGCPVCIPKDRVKKIKMVQDEAGTADGGTQLRDCWFFQFYCDESSCYYTDVVAADELERSVDILHKHFPNAEISNLE